MATYKVIGGDKKVYGPVNDEELRRWIADGRVNGQSLIQPEGTTEWRPVSSFPEFAELLGLGSGAPPAAAPALPVDARTFEAEVLAREPALNVGACLAGGWRLLWANFGLVFGASAVLWIISVVCERIPLVGPLGFMLIRGPLLGGVYLILLKRIRNQPASLTEIFAGFQQNFLQLMLVGLVSSFLAGLACCLFVLPWVYLLVAWALSTPLVADRRLEFWSAMELSRKVVTRVWFSLFALLVVAYLPTLLVNLFVGLKVGASVASTLQGLLNGGAPDPQQLLQTMAQMTKAALPFWLLGKVVFLLNLPFALGALMYAYEALFGARPTSAA